MEYDSDKLDFELLNTLFPFHVVVSTLDFGCLCIVSMGNSLKKLTDREYIGESLLDHFTVEDPKGYDITAGELNRLTSSFFVLSLTFNPNVKIRGQWVVNSDRQMCFVGSLLIDSSTTIKKNGLSLKDFAHHDATPGLAILHSLNQIQVSQQKNQAKKLYAIIEERNELSIDAKTDPLTRIFNRRSFWYFCNERINSGNSDHAFYILLIDLNKFKAVNDSHGHHVGDLILISIADRLSHFISENEAVARIGGDEFAMLLDEKSRSDVLEMQLSLQELLRKPMQLGTLAFQMDPSIGATKYVSSQSVDTLIQEADAAMYEGKFKGDGQFTWFHPSMHEKAMLHEELTCDLKIALSNGAITPAFQAIVDLKTKNLIGFEALARWIHPVHGYITPDVFIDIAQKCGVIQQLDYAILNAALEQLTLWRRKGHDITVQVNLSGGSIVHGLSDCVSKALNKHKISADYLILEVTETWLLGDIELAASVLQDVADLGVRLHLDDFGTGYSSLAHLHAFPIHGLKIDREFVSNMETSKQSREIVEATLLIAKTMNLEVVGEGIETQAQSDLLCQFNCDYGQGYFFSKPLFPEEIETFFFLFESAA